VPATQELTLIKDNKHQTTVFRIWSAAITCQFTVTPQISQMCVVLAVSEQRHNIPYDTSEMILGVAFTEQMTQPTLSKH